MTERPKTLPLEVRMLSKLQRRLMYLQRMRAGIDRLPPDDPRRPAMERHAQGMLALVKVASKQEEEEETRPILVRQPSRH
jgi:hypothetical protein